MLFHQHTFLFASVLSLALQAIAINPGDLHITVNQNLLNKNNAVFGSVLQIPGVSKWTNGQIFDLASVAHEEMIEVFREKEADKTGKAGSKVLGNGAPNVMAVVVTEDDFAIISSSMRGPSILFDFARQTINPPSPDITKVYHTTKNPRGMCPAAVMEGLMMCEKESKVKTVGTMQHFFGGSCGEVMAAWAMCDVLGENHPTKARVIAVEKAQTTEQRVIRDPCGAEGETDDWSPKGCTAFNRKFQWTAIPANTVRQPAGSLQNMKVYHATYNISPKKSARWFRE